MEHALAKRVDQHDAQANDWALQIERGPDWLFIRLEPRSRAATCDSLVEGIWEALVENGAHRVLLELDDAGPLDDTLIGSIARLGSRVREQGGMIRLCGLSQPDLRVLKARGAATDIAHFDSRAEAVGVPRLVPR